MWAESMGSETQAQAAVFASLLAKQRVSNDMDRTSEYPVTWPWKFVVRFLVKEKLHSSRKFPGPVRQIILNCMRRNLRKSQAGTAAH